MEPPNSRTPVFEFLIEMRVFGWHFGLGDERLVDDDIEEGLVQGTG
jgi:hypothetical protein